jgi:hypothetical protein
VRSPPANCGSETCPPLGGAGMSSSGIAVCWDDLPSDWVADPAGDAGVLAKRIVVGV